MTDAAGPLRGIRVLDACDELAVYATKLLVSLGADVVRIEPPDGDPMRRYPPLVDGVSLYFEHFNAGKRSVTLATDSERGAERLGRLVAGCNAVVESGDAANLLSSRVGLERLRGFRPDLVLVSVTPFGLSGPSAAHTGGDLVVTAASGLLALSGRPDGPPFRPGGEQGAHMAGLAAANAALLGIFAQQRTGQGCQIEVPASFAATLATLQTANANYYTWHGRVPKRRGIGGLSGYRALFQAADGWVVLVVLPGQWPNMVRLLAAHDAVGDLDAPVYLDAEHRMQESAHINDVFAAFTRAHTRQQLFDAAQNAGVACVPVNYTDDLLSDPFLARRGFFRKVAHPRLGQALDYPGPPVHFARREIGTWSPAPELGQDDEAIWEDELGLEREAVAAR